jgi:hypothetical protein
MKAVIHAKTKNGELVIQNLQKLEKIFSKPAIRFTLRAGIPKKYKRGVLGFKLECEGSGMIFSMPENPMNKNSKKEILQAVNNLIKECDGEPSDCIVEVSL